MISFRGTHGLKTKPRSYMVIVVWNFEISEIAERVGIVSQVVV